MSGTRIAALRAEDGTPLRAGASLTLALTDFAPCTIPPFPEIHIDMLPKTHAPCGCARPRWPSTGRGATCVAWDSLLYQQMLDLDVFHTALAMNKNKFIKIKNPHSHAPNKCSTQGEKGGGEVSLKGADYSWQSRHGYENIGKCL